MILRLLETRSKEDGKEKSLGRALYKFLCRAK